MPIYEYRCAKCGCKFEKLTSISQADGKVSCPKCKGSARRVMSRFVSKTTSDLGFTNYLGGAGGGGGCSSCGGGSCNTCGG